MAGQSKMLDNNGHCSRFVYPSNNMGFIEWNNISKLSILTGKNGGGKSRTFNLMSNEFRNKCFTYNTSHEMHGNKQTSIKIPSFKHFFSISL